MSPPQASPESAALLGVLPDDPMHVEARGLLLGRPGAVVIGDSVGGRGGFVFAPKHGIAAGFGEPPLELAEELRDVADGHGMVQEGIELHVPFAGADDWMARSDTRLLCEHRIQTFDDSDDPDALAVRWGSLLRHENVLLKSAGDALLETLPRALRGEFAAMDPWPVVVASLAGGSIASIASAFVETEGYFDVSIDTVGDFRRAGFGTSCAAALIQHQAARGKRPVWMVRGKNLASLALSQKLGFRDAGLVVGIELR